MANALKGEAIVKVEAGEFTLAYDLGALVAIEGETGKSLQDALNELDGDSPKVSTMLVVLWAGLKKHHNFTQDEAGHVVSLEELEIWGAALGALFAAAGKGAKPGTRPRKAAKTA